LAGKLGGNRQDFWKLLKSEKVGLITFEESEVDQIEGIGETEFENVILCLILADCSFSRINEIVDGGGFKQNW
jgi:hypothetical protein